MSTPRCLDADTIRAVLKRDDVRGLWPHELSAEVAGLFGEAFAALLGPSGAAAPVVVVGHDARIGSLELGLAFCRGLRQRGAAAVWLGLVSTEQVYYLTGRYPERYAGGAMITASHNPKEYNGIKFVRAGARPLDAADLARLCDLAIAGLSLPPALEAGEEFAAFLLERAGMAALPRTRQARFRVVVAAGNGVGGAAFAPLAKALEPWGFRFTMVDGEPDGDFPRGVPNPLLPGFIRGLGRAVRAEGAALGIGFDGDGDRAGFTDEAGREITGAEVLGLVTARKLAALPAGLGEPVVMRNLCGSRLLVDLCAAHPGVTLIDTPVGHGKIKLLMRHAAYRDRVIMAGEHSGHYFYPEMYSVDSGMLTTLYMLQILSTAAGGAEGGLAQRLRPWRRRYAWSGEINYVFADHAGPARALDAVARNVADGQRYEVRADPALGGLERVFPAARPYDRAGMASPDLKVEWCAPDGASGWWFVLRPSGNEPKLRLNVEAWGANARSRMRERVAAIAPLIAAAGGCRHG